MPQEYADLDTSHKHLYSRTASANFSKSIFNFNERDTMMCEFLQWLMIGAYKHYDWSDVGHTLLMDARIEIWSILAS